MPVEVVWPQPDKPLGSRNSMVATGGWKEGAQTRLPLPPAETDTSPLYKTDEFRIYCLKVLPCSKRFSHDWTVCPFSHPQEKARRRDPRLFAYTGIACPEMKKSMQCPRGDACPYAHNVFEYWLHPSRYRTQLCNDGGECRRKICFFAHSLEELRVPSCKPVSPDAMGHMQDRGPARLQVVDEGFSLPSPQYHQQRNSMFRPASLHDDNVRTPGHQSNEPPLSPLMAADTWDLASHSSPSPATGNSPYLPASPMPQRPPVAAGSPTSRGLDVDQLADAMAGMQMGQAQDPGMVQLINVLLQQVCVGQQQQQQLQQHMQQQQQHMQQQQTGSVGTPPPSPTGAGNPALCMPCAPPTSSAFQGAAMHGGQMDACPAGSPNMVHLAQLQSNYADAQQQQQLAALQQQVQDQEVLGSALQQVATQQQEAQLQQQQLSGSPPHSPQGNLPYVAVPPAVPSELSSGPGTPASSCPPPYPEVDFLAQAAFGPSAGSLASFRSVPPLSPSQFQHAQLVQAQAAALQQQQQHQHQQRIIGAQNVTRRHSTNGSWEMFAASSGASFFGGHPSMGGHPLLSSLGAQQGGSGLAMQDDPAAAYRGISRGAQPPPHRVSAPGTGDASLAASAMLTRGMFDLA